MTSGSAVVEAEAEGQTEQNLSRPLVFLDIDGVLNRCVWAKQIRLEEDLVERLKKLIDETGAEIVLTTWWRRFEDYIRWDWDRCL